MIYQINYVRDRPSTWKFHMNLEVLYLHVIIITLYDPYCFRNPIQSHSHFSDDPQCAFWTHKQVGHVVPSWCFPITNNREPQSTLLNHAAVPLQKMDSWLLQYFTADTCIQSLEGLIQLQSRVAWFAANMSVSRCCIHVYQWLHVSAWNLLCSSAFSCSVDDPAIC